MGNQVYCRREKIFFRDPFAARAFAVILTALLLRAVLIEWVVQEHVPRKFGEVYFRRNGYEVDMIAGSLKVEVRTGKQCRRYSRGVTVLSDEDVPFFLLDLWRSSESSQIAGEGG